MYLSDALSRLSSHNTKQGKQTEIKCLSISVHDVETDVKDSTLKRICTNPSTKADGWPGTTNECAGPACAYFTYREEFAIIDALLVKGNCTVILTDMHHDCLETLYASYLGVNKTLMQVCTLVFWPGMTIDIIILISNCPACQKFQSKQPPENPQE